ncbi:MAG: hypothetical protein E6Q98_01300 [Rhodospirillaceae bacterium]|nr:MAG: hypothetical protein E6Q98_01300 [Rhodospirillaceae bacterium]
MQTVETSVNGQIKTIEIPDADTEVVPGVSWGKTYEILSPAFWFILAHSTDDPTFGYIREDGDLRSEVGFCLLGGFGITAELATAAFERLSAEGIFDDAAEPTEEQILKLLDEPLQVGDRRTRYRFPRQRSTRLAQAMRHLTANPPCLDNPLRLRNELQMISGIGPKTASWIVRNVTGSDDVAILDIHIIRACRIMRLFGDDIRLPKDYLALEERFLAFARGLGVGAATLDALIWTNMRRLRSIPLH